MAKIMRITERDLTNMVKKVLKEHYQTKKGINENKSHKMINSIVEQVISKLNEGGTFEEREPRAVMIYNSILEDYKAEEIAEEENIESTDEAAMRWFEDVSCDGEWEEETMPKYARYIDHSEYGGFDLYLDYGANYYFAVQSEE